MQEVRYITKDQAETSARYERRSTPITANQLFGEWNRIFPDHDPRTQRRELQMDYCDVQRLFDALMPAGQFRCYWKSHLLGDLSDAAIDEAIENAAQSPSDRMLSSIWNFGGATAAVPADETAFGNRSFGWMYSLDMVWSDPADDQRMIEWTRAAWCRARVHAMDRRLYLNFAGNAGESAELTRDAFGRNYSVLAKIKRNYDPRNLFRVNQNIAPSR